MNKSLKTMKEIADTIGVSKSTVYRYIKAHSIHESSQSGSTLLYDESIEKLIKQGILRSNDSYSESQKTSYESSDSTDQTLIMALNSQIETQNNQLFIKDTQISNLQKSNDQLQQLLLYEQQKTTQLLEQTQKEPESKWWQFWK
ncbi:helix-turn-helix transcriptional regulator [Enterococcus sp. AZ102]|uniref:helix-turn-helix transcriptional regulator n=1 Tax=Enterococcus sp. AZ102 TaxID=2774865 RepID=UPI003F29DC1F